MTTTEQAHALRRRIAQRFTHFILVGGSYETAVSYNRTIRALGALTGQTPEQVHDDLLAAVRGSLH